MKKYLLFVVAFAAIAMYLMVPGCGNKSNNNNNPAPIQGTFPGGPGTVCIPGQQGCVATNPAGGVPLLNGPSLSSLDYRGSMLVLSYAAVNITPGHPYNGPVNIAGTITLAQGACYLLPPGQYPLQGQGNWISNYGGAVAGVEANLQMPSGNVMIYAATIRYGQNPNIPGAPLGYYLQGQVQISGCGVFTAL